MNKSFNISDRVIHKKDEPLVTFGNCRAKIVMNDQTQTYYYKDGVGNVYYFMELIDLKYENFPVKSTVAEPIWGADDGRITTWVLGEHIEIDTQWLREKRLKRILNK